MRRSTFLRMTDKGEGLSLRGVAFMTVLAVLENTLPYFCLSYKIQCQEATVTVLTVLVVLAVWAVLYMTATPLKLKPPWKKSCSSKEPSRGCSQPKDLKGVHGSFGKFWEESGQDLYFSEDDSWSFLTYS